MRPAASSCVTKIFRLTRSPSSGRRTASPPSTIAFRTERTTDLGARTRVLPDVDDVVCDLLVTLSTMRLFRASSVNSLVCMVLAVGACKHHDGEDIDAGVPADACEGLGCSIVNCGAQGLPTTTVSGTVYAPNGTLPLYGVTVYVPISDPGALPAGVQCDRCVDDLPGGAYTQTITD